MRFERKYKVEGFSLAEVKQLLRFHPASFRTLYPDRQVNNIYFDTPAMQAFNQNGFGINQRKKYRVRWYGDDVRKVQAPQLEVKIKHNELGRKEIQNLTPFSLQDLAPLTQAVNNHNKHYIALRPVLLNSYKRSYYISMDGNFRLTIDHHLRYHSLIMGPSFRQYMVQDPSIIIEIKYEQDWDEEANHITQRLPLRQVKYSKYVTGVQLTNK